MIPPKRFDISPLTRGCSEGLDAFRFLFEPTAAFRAMASTVISRARSPAYFPWESCTSITRDIARLTCFETLLGHVAADESVLIVARQVLGIPEERRRPRVRVGPR